MKVNVKTDDKQRIIRGLEPIGETQIDIDLAKLTQEQRAWLAEHSRAILDVFEPAQSRRKKRNARPSWTRPLRGRR